MLSLITALLLVQQFNAQPVDIAPFEITPTRGITLQNDNNTPAVFAGFWDSGNVAYEKLWTDSANYPLTVDSIIVGLIRYDTTFVLQGNFKFGIYACNDSGRPYITLGQTSAIPIALTGPLPVAGLWTIDVTPLNITIPLNRREFAVGIEWVDKKPVDSCLVSILLDSQIGIPTGINWYFFQGLWLEHHLLWQGPDSVGVNILRAVVTPSTAVKQGKNIKIPSFTVSPNPVRCGARLSYNLEEKADISLGLYNSRGSLLATLDSGVRNKGRQWVRVPSDIAPGVYLLKIRVDNTVYQNKLVISR
jgi:hypothetical protein